MRNGLGALLVTNGVSALSAINGVAGSYKRARPGHLHLRIDTAQVHRSWPGDAPHNGRPLPRRLRTGDRCAARISPRNAVTEIERLIKDYLRPGDVHIATIQKAAWVRKSFIGPLLLARLEAAHAGIVLFHDTKCQTAAGTLTGPTVLTSLTTSYWSAAKVAPVTTCVSTEPIASV
jgi:hypothetical protein